MLFNKERFNNKWQTKKEKKNGKKFGFDEFLQDSIFHGVWFRTKKNTYT